MIFLSTHNCHVPGIHKKCIDYLENLSDRSLLQGIGELLDEEMKRFVKTKLRIETIALFKIYKDMPLLEEYNIDN